MRNTVTINRQAPDDAVYMVMQLFGHLNPVVATPSTVALANRAATIGVNYTAPGRRFTVGVELRPRLITDSLALTRLLKERFRGLVELATIDAPGQCFYGVLEDVKVDLYTAIYANPIRYVEFVFRCDDPAHEDLEPYTRALSAMPVACPVGNAITQPVMHVRGSATPVTGLVVTVRDHRGEPVSTLALTPPTGISGLAANDTLVIDTAAQSIDRYVSGVLQTGTGRGEAWLTSGTFPLLSPEDAAPEREAWPTVDVTASAGTPTGVLLARPMWN